MKLNIHQIQERELKILIEFSKFCKQNKLRYYLAYGTLIGAVRHSGFIPWDDDIDVMMPRPDYEEFLRLTKAGFLNNYKVLSHEHNSNYIYLFAKIIDTNTFLEEPTIMKEKLGLYIDIFPLDVVPSDKRELSKYKKIMKVLLLAHKMSIKKLKGRDNLTTIIKGIIFPFFRIIGYRRWISVIDRHIKNYSWDEGNYVCNVTSDIDKEIIDKNMLDSIIEIKFENTLFYTFTEYDTILKNFYGNYMELPPIDKRVGHFNEVQLINE